MNSKYWAKRQEQLWDQLEKDEAKLVQKLSKQYDKELSKLDKEIAAYYAKYGKDNVIAYNNLMQQLDPQDKILLIEKMDEFAQKFPEYAELMPVRESVYKLNRLQGLQQSVYVQQMNLGILDKGQLEKHLSKVYETGNKAAMEALGIGSSFQVMRKDVMEQTINAKWVNDQNFSDRIWGDRRKLSAYINQEMGASFARGDSYDRCAKRIKEIYSDVSMNNIKRLVRTEGSFVLNQATKQVFEGEFAEYRYLALNEKNPCKVCISLHGTIFKYKDAQKEMNFPPMHPNCKCDHSPIIPEDYLDSTIQQAKDLGLYGNVKVDVDDAGIISLTKKAKAHRFDSIAEVKKWEKSAGKRALHDFLKEVTEEERRGIRDYTNHTFEKINQSLRKGNLTKAVQKKVEILDSALTKYHLEDTMVTYRGTSIRGMGIDFDSPQDLVGKIYVEKAYISTSLLKDATVFKAVAMELRIPPEMGGAYINDLSDFFDEEFEFLVARGSQFVILDAFYEIDDYRKEEVLKIIMEGVANGEESIPKKKLGEVLFGSP